MAVRIRIGTEVDVAVDGAIFDLDGVVTDTASVHESAWAAMFNDYLRERSSSTGAPFMPFTDNDYTEYVDGKPRYDGVRSFLASRGIVLDWGSRDDPSEAETVCGLGNRKNDEVDRIFISAGVQVYETTVALITQLRRHGAKVAVASSSENCGPVLDRAGLSNLFDYRFDGVNLAQEDLPGKPDPAMFLAAASGIGVMPARAVVIEDAISGVRAGRRGGFGLVIGVARHDNANTLVGNGADVAVCDLAEVTVVGEE